MIFGQFALVIGWSSVNHRSLIGGLVLLVLVLLAVAGLWLLVSRELPHADAAWTRLIPGSLFYAVGLLAVEVFNVLILSNLMQEKSTTYGALGIAATLLLGFFFMWRVIVIAAVLNSTLYARHTRSTGSPG